MWPHAPRHFFEGADTFIVTASTLHHAHHFRDNARLELLQNSLFELSAKYSWQLHAWALFSNHYHFVAQTNDDPGSLRTLLRHFHANTAREINKLDHASGRQVWFQYWDTRLTFEKSYLARLRYTQENAVRHKLVEDARAYPYCSAAWFEKTATTKLKASVAACHTDKLNLQDDYHPIWSGVTCHRVVSANRNNENRVGTSSR